jgi:hypothetical protein
MTEAQQRKFYFPAWNRAAGRHDWVMRGGRLVGKRLDVFGLAQVNGLYQRVWAAAAERALQGHRGVTAEDLRHGCHVVALGQDKGSGDLTSGECDRVVCLFRLMADPDDLDAQIAWEHPEEGEKKRLKWVIGQAAPEAYISAISKDRFGTIFWETDLSAGQLRQLLMTLKGRQRKWSGKGRGGVSSVKGQVSDGEENPF